MSLTKRYSLRAVLIGTTTFTFKPAVAQRLRRRPTPPLSPSASDVAPRLRRRPSTVLSGPSPRSLLESLTRLPAGRAPPSVRLTVVGPAATPPAPFAASPPGYNFAPHLLRYAKSINLGLEIGRAASLESVQGFCAPGEALVVCLQFRLGHVAADERTEILRKVRGLSPQLVVLLELDVGGDGSAAEELAARLEQSFRSSTLESTSVAFKGRDGDGRRLMEAEAGTAVAVDVAGEGREGWRERMAMARFEGAMKR